MKKVLRRALAVCTGLLALVVFTPLGPAALVRLLERGSGDWHVAIGDRAGAFSYGFSLADIHCQNKALGVEIAIDLLDLKPWSWTVEVRGPKVRVEPASETRPAVAEAPADIELPIALLPDLVVTAGQLHWTAGQSLLSAGDWRASYRAVGDTSGLLVLELSQLGGTRSLQSLRSLKLELMLSAQRVDIGVVEAAGGDDGLSYGAQASFALGLALPRPLQLAVETTIDGPADSLQGVVDLTIEGAVEPLRLSGQVTGRGRSSVVGESALQGDLHIDGDRLELDDLLVELLDGQLTGRASYFIHSDSVQTELKGVGLDLARVGLAGVSSVGGRAGFDFGAEAQLDAGRYTADFAADVRGLELGQDERFDVAIKAGHKPDGQTRIELNSRLLSLAAIGDSDMEGGYDLTLHGGLQSAFFVSGAAPVQITGRVRPDTLAVQLTSDHLPGELGRPFGPLKAELNLSANSRLDAVVRVERDLLLARAAIDLAAGRVDTLVVGLHGLELGRVIPDLAGVLDIDVVGSGGLALEQLQLQGAAHTTALHYAGWRNGGLALDVLWDRGAVQSQLRGEGLHVRADLRAGGYLEAQTEFAGRVLSGPDGGEVELHGTLDWTGPLGDASAMQGRMQLDSLSLSQGAWTLQGRGPTAVDYRDNRFALSQVDLQTPIGPLALSGWAGFDSLAIAAEWPQLGLGGLMPELEAAGAGHLHLSGTWDRPEAQGAMVLRQVALDTLSLGGVELRLDMADSLVAEVDAEVGLRLALRCPAGPSLGAGRAHLGVAAVAADVGPALSYMLGYPLRGQLDLDGAIEMALGDSVLGWEGMSGHIDVRGMVVETEVDADSLRLDLLNGSRFELEEGRVKLDSLIIAMHRYDRDRLAMRPAGTMRLGGQLAADGFSQVGLDVQGVELVFLGGPEGVADLEARLSGSAAEPELAAQLWVETEDFGELRGELLGDGMGGDLHLNWTTLIEDSLVVTGHMPWDLAVGTFDLQQSWLEARSEGIGLFVFADLIADLDYLDGRIGAEVRIDGLDSTLAISGRIGVEELQVAPLDIKPVYSLPDGELRIAGRRVELNGFVAAGETERGYRRMELSGGLDLAQLDEPHFDLRLVAERLSCRYEDIFKADNIHLDLAFAGAPSKSKLKGRIRLNQPRSEPTLVVFNAPPIPPPPPALRDEFLENMALAVEVDLRGLVLDSELAELEASGAVEVGGTFYKPLFQGDMGIDEGRIYVLNQQFEFEQGRVVFNSLEPTGSILDVAYDPLELDPELDLRATTMVEDRQDKEQYEVTLTLQGRAKTAAPEFMSVPARDFSDIVMLLAFGSTETHDYSAALGTVAGQLLSSRVERVGLDEFAVLPSSTVVGAEPGAAIRVGKYFSRLPLPLWVRYEALLNEMSSGEVRIEHKLKSFLTVTGSAQSEYDRYGLGIGMKKKF